MPPKRTPNSADKEIAKPASSTPLRTRGRGSDPTPISTSGLTSEVNSSSIPSSDSSRINSQSLAIPEHSASGDNRKREREDEDKDDEDNEEGDTADKKKSSTVASTSQQFHEKDDNSATKTDDHLTSDSSDLKAVVAERDTLAIANSQLESELQASAVQIAELEDLIATLRGSKSCSSAEGAIASQSSTTPGFAAVQTPMNVQYLNDLDPQSIQQFVAQFQSGVSIRPSDLMSRRVRQLLSNIFEIYYRSPTDWMNWSHDVLSNTLSNTFPSGGNDAVVTYIPLMDRLQSFRFRFDITTPREFFQCLLELVDIEQSTRPEDLQSEEANACAFLITDRLARNDNPILRAIAPKLGLNSTPLRPRTLNEFRVRLLTAVQETKAQLWAPSPAGQLQLKGDNRTSGESVALPKQEPTPTCSVCGRQGHFPATCRFLNPGTTTSWHPNANLTGIPWLTSFYGKEFLRKQNLNYLPYTMDTDGKKVTPPPSLNIRITEKNKHSSKSLVTA